MIWCFSVSKCFEVICVPVWFLCLTVYVNPVWNLHLRPISCLFFALRWQCWHLQNFFPFVFVWEKPTLQQWLLEDAVSWVDILMLYHRRLLSWLMIRLAVFESSGNHLRYPSDLSLLKEACAYRLSSELCLLLSIHVV